jgi:exodeoxyribonuclease-3
VIIATFNCNSIRTRINHVLDWLESNTPDVLALQETKVQDKQFPVEPFINSGYVPVYRGQKSYNGVAFLLKNEPDSVMYGFNSNEDEASRLIAVSYNGIQFINSYIPQGHSVDSDKYQYKLDWYDRMKQYLFNNYSAEEMVIWCGDFNVALTDLDVHDPKKLKGHVCFNQDVQNKLNDCNSFGFIDILRKHHPEKDVYTFWDYRVRNGVENNIGWRIDYIQATRSLAEKSVRCWVDVDFRKREKPSDHTMLAAEFNL